jgi:hypothetical protein
LLRLRVESLNYGEEDISDDLTACRQTFPKAI